MKRGILLIAVCSACLTLTHAAVGQVVDVTTLTCDDLKNKYGEAAEVILARMIGAGDPKASLDKIDLKAMGGMFEKIESFCDKNGKSTVVKAIEAGSK